MGSHLKKWAVEAEQQGRKTRWIRPRNCLHKESHLMRCLEQGSMKY